MTNPDSSLNSGSVTANIGYKLTKDALLAQVVGSLAMKTGLITSQTPGTLEVRVVESLPFLTIAVDQAALNNGGYQGPLTIYSNDGDTVTIEYLEQLRTLLERGNPIT